MERGPLSNAKSGSRPDRHGVMKDVVGIVTPFDLLKEGEKFTFAVIKLRPEGIGEHVSVGIVDVTPFVLFVVPRGSLVVRIGIGTGIKIGVEVAHPLEAAGVLLWILPVALELELEDRGPLGDGGCVGKFGLIDGSAVGVGGKDATHVDAGHLAREVLVDDTGLVASKASLHIGGLVLGACAAAETATNGSVVPGLAVHVVRAGAGKRRAVRLGKDAGGTGLVAVTRVHGLRLGSNGLAGLKEVDELIEDLQVITGSIGIAELDGDADATGGAVRETEKGEHAPGVGVLAARFHVVAVGGEDGLEALGGHTFPGKGHVDVHDLAGSYGHLVEVVGGNDAEVVSAGSTAGAEEVRLLCAVDAALDDGAGGVNGEDVDGGEPVDGEAVQAAEDAVASSGDVASGCDPVAGASGEGDAVVLVELSVGVAEPGSGSDLVGVSAACGVHAGKLAEIEQDAARVVADEVLVAVASGADGGAQAGADGLLQGLGDVVGIQEQLNTAGSVCLGGGPAKVVASPQNLVARVLRQNGDRHVAP